MPIAFFLAVVQAASAGVAQDSQPRFRPDSAAVSSAYENAATRELVRRARSHRGALDASVFRYRATIRQRVSVGIRALRRDRLLYRRESAARVDWRRDGASRVEVVGAREAVPVALPGVRIPDDLEDWALSFLPEPGGDRLFVSVDGGGFAWHPLVEGGEAVYRYAIGDTTEIRLPGGRPIRLVELRVTPRERDIRLIAGSFWIETDDHAIVQAVFRPSREFDLERDLPVIDPGEAEADEIPGILKPVKFDLRYITIDYGLWEMRWWMPRVVALDGYLQLGPATFPLSFEVTYSDYAVEADRLGLPELPPVYRDLAGDPTDRRRPIVHDTRVVIADSAALLDSPLLPESLFGSGDEGLLSEREVRELGRRLAALPPPPWQATRPRVAWPWALGRGLLRYNRVEGLSAGARVDWDLTRARVDLTARLGSADLEPGAELGFELPALRRTWRLAGYRRLAVVDPDVRPFALGNSLGALLYGRDEGLYYRAAGAELRVRPAPGEARYEVRLFAERQWQADVDSDFSLRHVLDGEFAFRPNIRAERVTVAGFDARVGVDRGLDPRGVRWGAWADVAGAAGDAVFLRPGLTLRLSGPLPGRLIGGLELAAGTTLESDDAPAPPQSLWYLGGPATVRGFDAGVAAGRDQARARAELASSFPAARLALFGDAGWAGDRADYREADVLLSAGVGASFLDGLLRLDLARAIQPDRHWRLDLYVDALF